MSLANPTVGRLGSLVQATTTVGVTLNTDVWRAYKRLSDLGRGHMTVNHGAKEWARDDDGDGVREVQPTRWRGPGRGCGRSVA